MILDHVKFGVLGVLGKVFLNRLSVAEVSEGERLKVVLQTEIVVHFLLLVLQLLDEPHVTIRGEEKLAGDLIHFMLADDATAQTIVQLLLNVHILVIGDHVHDKR